MTLKSASQIIRESGMDRDERKITITTIGELKYFSDTEKGMQDRAKKYGEKALEGVKKAMLKKYKDEPGIENSSMRMTKATCQVIKSPNTASVKIYIVVYPIRDEEQGKFLMNYIGEVMQRAMFSGEVKKSYDIS